MSKDSVIAYWIEEDNLEFCSRSMGSNDIFRGGTYANEVITKYARNPLDFEVVVIPFSQSGNDWAKSAIQNLKNKATTVRVTRGQ